MRYDLFLIYGHGLPHARQIVSLIREAFDILYIQRIDIGDAREFVEAVYRCDSVPIQHLRGKTAYLLDQPPQAMAILVRNGEPDERVYGEGAFAHVQCAKVKAVKQAIREAFNPSPDAHVVHATDYESQTRYLLDYFWMPPIEWFERAHDEFDLAPHVKLGSHRVRVIGLDAVLAREINRCVPLDKSLCYRFVKGDRQPYADYAERVIGWIDHADHYPEAFDRLIERFDYNDRNLIVVKESERRKGCYEMVDGNHRAAILLGRGHGTVEAIVC